MREEALLLLRVWRNGGEPGAWRASLEDLHSRETLRFGSLEALCRHLETRGEHAGPAAALSGTPARQGPLPRRKRRSE